MIYHDVEQNTPEWEALRAGIPTTSCFERILTPTGKASKQYDDYAYELVAEYFAGRPINDFEGTDYTRRGHELEEEARNYYQLLKDVEVKPGGFVTNDDKTIGCSPDGLVGEDGVLEIKCVATKNHMRAMLGALRLDKYKPQNMGQLWICERKWVDRVYYHPILPPVIETFERDESYISQLSDSMDSFLRHLDSLKEKINKLKEAA